MSRSEGIAALVKDGMLSEVLVKKEISLNVLWSTVKNLLLHEPILFDVVYSVCSS